MEFNLIRCRCLIFFVFSFDSQLKSTILAQELRIKYKIMTINCVNCLESFCVCDIFASFIASTAKNAHKHEYT